MTKHVFHEVSKKHMTGNLAKNSAKFANFSNLSLIHTNAAINILTAMFNILAVCNDAYLCII